MKKKSRQLLYHCSFYLNSYFIIVAFHIHMLHFQVLKMEENTKTTEVGKIDAGRLNFFEGSGSVSMASV